MPLLCSVHSFLFFLPSFFFFIICIFVFRESVIAGELVFFLFFYFGTPLVFRTYVNMKDFSSRSVSKCVSETLGYFCVGCRREYF